MPKYLIEVKHDATKAACDEAIKVFLDTGSHFLANADWGCMDDEHKAWFFLEIENKDMAMSIVPPTFRNRTRIIELLRFEKDDLEKADPVHQ
jgi:hypothetical protein